MGKIFGNECLDKGVAQLYGPSADMHRTPYGGRAYEYPSEDPFLAGTIEYSESKGIESKASNETITPSIATIELVAPVFIETAIGSANNITATAFIISRFGLI